MPPLYRDSDAEAIYGGLNRSIAKVERALAKEYRAALKGINGELAALYQRYAAQGELTYAEMTKYNRLSKLEAEIVRILAGMGVRVERQTKRLAAAQYEESFFRHAYTIEKKAGVSLAWGMLRPESIAAAVANPLDKIAHGTLKANERARVRRAVTQALIKGESYNKMARAVKTALSSSLSDALRIARTEAHRAQMDGSVAAFDRAEKQGVKVRRLWVATKDERTRDTHRALDQEPAVEKDGEYGWYVGGTWATKPGDERLPPEEVINCRCVVTEEVEGLEPELIRVRGAGVQKYKDYMASTKYEDWKKGKK